MYSRQCTLYNKNKMKKKLILESGEVFHGVGFGANVDTEGEVVFNTGMSGYQELISILHIVARSYV